MAHSAMTAPVLGPSAYFGLHARYNLQAGFPAVTTKKLAWKVMASELLWFISGSNNIEDLKRIYPQNKIWDANYADYLVRLGLTENDGDMGRVYGVQWRAWQTPSGKLWTNWPMPFTLSVTTQPPDAL